MPTAQQLDRISKKPNQALDRAIESGLLTDEAFAELAKVEDPLRASLALSKTVKVEETLRQAQAQGKLDEDAAEWIRGLSLERRWEQTEHLFDNHKVVGQAKKLGLIKDREVERLLMNLNTVGITL